jgi:phage tail-like protein
MVTYPSPAFHFTVEWGGMRIAFTEVSGMAIENGVIEYRTGQESDRIVKMPGLRKYNNVTLKRGVAKGDYEFYNWINTIKHNTVERRDIVISLLDENHEPVQVWKLRNAWPCKVEAPILNAQANEVAIESIELVHEGLEIMQ